MASHPSERDVSRERKQQPDCAVAAQRRCAEAATGVGKARAEGNLTALVDMKFAHGKSYALRVATELGVPQDAIVETLTAL